MANSTKPKIVCLIGSCRFSREFQRAAYELELEGVITVGPAFVPDVPADQHGGDVAITPEQKTRVDELFQHKIGMADEVLVINKGGYVGESTLRDLACARTLGKPLRWLEPPAEIPV